MEGGDKKGMVSINNERTPGASTLSKYVTSMIDLIPGRCVTMI